MTIDEKNKALLAFCQVRQHDCDNCPLNDGDTVCCYLVSGDLDEEDKKRVEENYAKVFPPVYDPVNHPSHYTQGGIDCIDAMVAAFGKKTVEDFCLCNAFKYVWRTRKKNGLEDCKKAQWYLNKYVEMVENEVDK